MPRILFLLIIILPLQTFSQDTVMLSDLTRENDLAYLHNSPFTGIAYRNDLQMKEYYQFCDGKSCGYLALHMNGDTAGIHIYNGNDIHMIFYTKQGKKTLEYNQRVLDREYMVGEWMDFRDDGTLQVKGNYDLIEGRFEERGGQVFKYQSVKDGKWEFYDEKGKLIKSEKWKKGRLLGTKDY
jgi:hypothetical protein